MSHVLPERYDALPSVSGRISDMRKGINSLIGVVKELIEADVRNGDVFIFIGSSRKLMKLLHAEDGGLAVVSPRHSDRSSLLFPRPRR